MGRRDLSNRISWDDTYAYFPPPEKVKKAKKGEAAEGSAAAGTPG